MKYLWKYTKSWIMWIFFRNKYRIGQERAALFLNGDNKQVNQRCIDFLPRFIERKYTKEAIIFYREDINSLCKLNNSRIKYQKMTEREMSALYELYCIYKYSDYIVFTSTDKPGDNQLERFLCETEINAEDVACLALYHFRRVPS